MPDATSIDEDIRLVEAELAVIRVKRKEAEHVKLIALSRNTSRCRRTSCEDVHRGRG